MERVRSGWPLDGTRGNCRGAFVPRTISETEVIGVAFEPETDVEQVHAYDLPDLWRVEGPGAR